MVETISPAYYATGEQDRGYVVKGSGFMSIPMDAVGIMSDNKVEPLKLIDSTNPRFLYSVNVRTDTRLELMPMQSATHNAPVYLGGIVSNDRSVVYYVNET